MISNKRSKEFVTNLTKQHGTRQCVRVDFESLGDKIHITLAVTTELSEQLTF